MRFWDASALVPLIINQPATDTARRLLAEDDAIVAWWGSVVECWSAFARLRRDRVITAEEEEAARASLRELQEFWREIQPGEEVRAQAARILRLHPLRAQDALQLSAALIWAGSPPAGQIITFDRRLQEVARLEGFTALP